MKGIALLLCLVPLAGPARKTEEQTDRLKMQGEWSVVAHEASGKKTAAKKLAAYKLTVAGSKMTTRDGAEVLDESTFTLSATSMPRRIDLTLTAGPDKGKKVLGIYKLEGEKWTMCVADVGGARPTAFATREKSGQMLFVFRRLKK